jgi:hypothetical protein
MSWLTPLKDKFNLLDRATDEPAGVPTHPQSRINPIKLFNQKSAQLKDF